MAELLLCADDFGLAPAVDDGIAELVAAGRIGAFSCLTNLPGWTAAAARVPALRGHAMAGLHLNLTEGAPASAALARYWPELPRLPRLLMGAHLRRLPLVAIAQELDAQWNAFETAAGHAPDFLDGHQHVHHLPGIREWVLARAMRARVPIRSTARLCGPGDAFKRLVIMHTGGRTLARGARRAGVPVNGTLLGAYGFTGDYRTRMRGWLTQVPAEGALLFCHPANPGSAQGPRAAADPIASARVQEYTYLRSDAFTQDLAEAGVTLRRAWPAAR